MLLRLCHVFDELNTIHINDIIRIDGPVAAHSTGGPFDEFNNDIDPHPKAWFYAVQRKTLRNLEQH